MSRRYVLLCVLLPLLLFAIAGAKTDTWLEVRTPHFLVLTNAGEKQARQVADQFERMRAVFHKRFPNVRVDDAAPITVIAVKDKKEFQALEPEAYLAKGQLNLAGLFLQTPDKNYVLLRLDAEGEHPYATVYHEYTHFITRHAGEWLPLWLQEGLAEFYQNTEIKEKEVGLGQPSSENLFLLRDNRLLPLATLLTVDHNSPYYHEESKGSIFYAESWALTHYLEIKDAQSNTEHMKEYLTLVSRKVDPVTAATQAFGDLNALEKNLQQYVSRASFYYFRMPGAIEVDNSTFQIQAVNSTEADAIRADFLAYNQRVKDSQTLLDRVLRDDPKSASARETMGFLAFRQGKLEEAAKWYDEAVQLDSKSFLAHYYFAAIAINQGKATERAAQVESSLRTATQLNPEFAPAFDQLAAFYGMQHKNLEEASMLSLKAIQMEPANVHFRLNRASLMMEMNRPSDAVAVLKNAMQISEKPEESAVIQSQMENIQRYQEARAQQEREERDFEEKIKRDQAEESGPKAAELPDDSRHGPQRTARGTIRGVKCGYPATITFKLEAGTKVLELYARNYYKVTYSALNFTPSEELNPCKEIEGMKAKVDYLEGLNGSPGQVSAVELAK